MLDFARYYIKFISELFSNLGKFFKNLFSAFADLFWNDIVGYFRNFGSSSSTFNFLDWLIAIIVIIINVAFIGFVLIRLYQLIRKYVKFVRKEVEKDNLLDEISGLNQRLVEVTNEKNKIFALKMENMGLLNENQDPFSKKKKKELGDSRFTKLIAVDQKYEGGNTVITMKGDDMIGLKEITQKFINFSASQLGLFYKTKTVATFFAGMATSRLIILEGISGTGKTSLPYAMGKFFGNDSHIVSVQPSWRDRAEMIGYLNEFTKKFNETDFLQNLYETTYHEDLNFIVLDEMNLARVEYYFAEFLSIMEMPDPSKWIIDIVPEQLPTDPKNLPNGKLLVPQNVWFIGTANRDDSTFGITDKVYDRATPLEINVKADFIDAPYTEGMTLSYEYLAELFDDASKVNAINPKLLENLVKLDDFITKKFKITFGNRIMKQIQSFIPVYVACGGSELEGLDFMVTRKILRKFEVLNLPFLQAELAELILFIEKTFGKKTFEEAISFINQLRQQI